MTWPSTVSLMATISVDARLGRKEMLGCGRDLRSRLLPSKEGGATGEGKKDGLLDTILAAGSVNEEDDVRTLWVDTDRIFGRRSQTQSLRDAPPPSQLWIWTRRLVPWTFRYISRELEAVQKT